MNDLKTLKPDVAWRPFEPSARWPWNRRLAAHLVRRTGFGEGISTLESIRKLGVDGAIEALFDDSQNEKTESEMATAGRLVTGNSDAKSLAAWWLLRSKQKLRF